MKGQPPHRLELLKPVNGHAHDGSEDLFRSKSICDSRSVFLCWFALSCKPILASFLHQLHTKHNRWHAMIHRSWAPTNARPAAQSRAGEATPCRRVTGAGTTSSFGGMDPTIGFAATRSALISSTWPIANLLSVPHPRALQSSSRPSAPPRRRDRSRPYRTLPTTGVTSPVSPHRNARPRPNRHRGLGDDAGSAGSWLSC